MIIKYNCFLLLIHNPQSVESGKKTYLGTEIWHSKIQNFSTIKILSSKSSVAPSCLLSSSYIPIRVNDIILLKYMNFFLILEFLKEPKF